MKQVSWIGMKTAMDRWTHSQTAEIIQRIFGGPAAIEMGPRKAVCMASIGSLAQGRDGVYDYVSCVYRYEHSSLPHSVD